MKAKYLLPSNTYAESWLFRAGAKVLRLWSFYEPALILKKKKKKKAAELIFFQGMP